MKPIAIAILLFCFSISCYAQNGQTVADNPFFAKLAEIKSASETDLKALFTEQQLAVNTITLVDDKDRSKDKAIQANFQKDKRCLIAYSNLKVSVDVLIGQLKADLTVSNSRKNLKNLNAGILGGWYQQQIKKITDNYTDFTDCVGGSTKSFAISASDITGIFTAIATVITSGRDFRVQMTTTICTQLDSYKLNDAYDILNGNASSSPAAAPTTGAAAATGAAAKPAVKH